MLTDEIVKIIVEAIVSIAIVLITGYVIPWLQAKIGVEKYELITKYTESAVRSAEQLYTPEEWKKKKEYVTVCVSERLADIGLELTVTDINNIIEGCVNAVKKANK